MLHQHCCDRLAGKRKWSVVYKPLIKFALCCKDVLQRFDQSFRTGFKLFDVSFMFPFSRFYGSTGLTCIAPGTVDVCGAFPPTKVQRSTTLVPYTYMTTSTDVIHVLSCPSTIINSKR